MDDAMDDGLADAARRLAAKLIEKGWMLATAESCTGGLIASSLTDLPGSSAWFAGGVVAYANSVKTGLLGVPGAIVEAHGAVSRETVLAMAGGARLKLGTQCALAVSGVAGPTGGTPEKPVGTVWIGLTAGHAIQAALYHFEGDRLAVKRQSAVAALQGLALLF